MIQLFLVAALALPEQLESAVKGFPAQVSLYAKNLRTGREISRHGDDPVRTASTIKLPIMMACFASATEGRLDLQEPVELLEKEKVQGSGILQDLSAGIRLPLRDMIQLMIVLSDNTATNLVLNRIGANAVNTRLGEWGFTQTRVMRKILRNDVPEGLSDEGVKPENKRWGLGRSSPHEMVRLLERLYRQDAAGDKSAHEMIDILKHQRDRDGILRDAVQTDARTSIANKSGALDHLRSDVGIVYGKEGDVAMAITIDGFPEVNWTPDNPALLLIARLSEILLKGLQ